MPEINILVKATDKASGVIQGMGSKIKGSVKKLIQLPHLIAAGAITVAIKGVVKAYGVQEEAIAKLGAAMKASGTYTESAIASLTEYAGALQKVTTFGDEEILAAQAMLATFKLTEEQIREITPVMLDMAAATGTDAVRAAVLMGKAAVGVTGELSRYGIIVDKTDLKNRGLAAVLDEVRLNFGGTAAAIAKTGVGPLTQFGNLVGDVQEKIGEALMPALTAIVAVLKDMLPAMQSIFVTFTKYIGDIIMGILTITKIVTKLPVLLSAVGVAVAVLGKKMLLFMRTMSRTNIIIAAGTAALFVLEEVSKRLEARIAKTTAKFEAENDALKALNRLTREGSGAREEALAISKRYAAVSLSIQKAEQGEIEVSGEMLGMWKKRRDAIASEAIELEKRVKAAKKAAADEEEAETEKSEALTKILEEKRDRVNELTMEEFDYRRQKVEEEYTALVTKHGADIELARWKDEEVALIEEGRAEKNREKRETEAEENQAYLESIKEAESEMLSGRLENLDEFYENTRKKYEKDKEATLKIDKAYEKAKTKLGLAAIKEKEKMEIEAAKNTLGTLKSTLNEAAGLETMGKEERKAVALASAYVSQALSLVRVWEGAAGFGPLAAVMAAVQTAIVMAKTTMQISKIQAMERGGLVTKPTLALLGERGPEVVTPLEDMPAAVGGAQVNINFQILDIEGLSPQTKQAWAEAIQPYLQLEQVGRGGE